MVDEKVEKMAHVRSITMDEAMGFLGAHKRHYNTGEEPIAAIGLYEGEELRGAAIIGRVAPRIGAIAHIYVDGAFQGYSLLYGACHRALHALGFEYIKL